MLNDKNKSVNKYSNLQLNDVNAITKFDDDEILTNSETVKNLEEMNLCSTLKRNSTENAVDIQESDIENKMNRFQEFLIDCFYYCCCECTSF